MACNGNHCCFGVGTVMDSLSVLLYTLLVFPLGQAGKLHVNLGMGACWRKWPHVLMHLVCRNLAALCFSCLLKLFSLLLSFLLVWHIFFNLLLVAGGFTPLLS